MPTHPLSGLKAASSCMYDIVSLGEVMLRLDPCESRIHTARVLNAWEGGGEYNVARGLRRCFNQRAAIVTALADNPIGRLVEDFMLQGGVDTRAVVWKPYDGVGRRTRNGLNFVERGFGPRPGLGCSDRGHTAISQIQIKDVDWDRIFTQGGGTRWFHTGGIFAALSDGTPEVALHAMRLAKQSGAFVSYDLNYRSSLWKDIGGQAKAREVNRALVPYVDVLFGNEEDFSAALGFELEGGAKDYSELDVELPAHGRARAADLSESGAGRHHPARGPLRQRQRLERVLCGNVGCRQVGRGQVGCRSRRSTVLAGADPQDRDPRSRGRWGFLRLGLYLWPARG